MTFRSIRPRITPFRTIWALMVTAMAACLSLVVQVHESAWVHADEVGLASATAETQSPAPCEGVTGIPFGTDPGWVRVGGSVDPNTPFVEVRGQIFRTHVTHEDNSANHFSHDINVYIIPDPAYRHLMSDGDMINEDPDELGFHNHATMENEWEYGGIPLFAWPSRRDRIIEWGALIWDCGHGDNDGPDDEDVYQTEIHPHVGWVVLRHLADADGSPMEEGKRTRNWIWYGDGDLQGAGASIASQGGTLSTVLQATIADAFFSSWGGDAPESINGCDGDDAPCTQDNEWFMPLLNQDYTFFVPAPPKPTNDPVTGAPTLVWESEDHCGEVPSNPGDPFGDDILQVGEADSLTDPTAVDIGAPTCGTIPDAVIQTTDANGTPGIQVTVKAQSSGVSYPANMYIAFAKRYKVSWDFVPAEATRARTYQVHFDHVRVWRSGDDGDAEWAWGLRVNEKWIFPVAGSAEDGLHFYEESSIDDNDNDCPGSDGDCDDYSINETLTVSVKPGEPINIWSRIIEADDPGPAVFDPNDVLPTYDHDHFGPGNFSTGLLENSDGAYEVFYTITDVTKASPTLGSLTIGAPQYGPNADTGGVVRVSGATPVSLEGSNASKLEYRIAANSQPLPTTWQFDPTSPFNIPITGQPDGKVKFQYAPVSSEDIVAERRSAIVELDTTPPVLTLPAPITVFADQTAGKVVNYVATAVDNLPGPVDFSCDTPSGSVFPNGKNAPLTTTVTCTAKDTVLNTSTGSFTVTVVSPFGYIPDFVILGREWVSISSGVTVQTGNVGGFDQSAGVPSQAGFEVVAGPSATFQGGSQIATHSDRIEASTHAGDVFYADQFVGGNNAVLVPKVGYVPLFFNMPAVPSFTAGGPNLVIAGTQVLAAGSYGKLAVNPNATLTLSGGNYYFTSIEVKPGARVRFSAASTLHVTGRVLVGNGAEVKPTAASGVLPHDVVLYAGGTDGPPNNPGDAIAIGSNAVVGINAYAPSGTLSVGSYANATGAFVGRRVLVGSNVVFRKDSVFVCP
jgi:hypothetical protein